MVLSGQIREIPTPLFWQQSVCGQGTNQNGGYWGVAAGQYATALKAADPAKSQQTLLDMVNFYKQHNAVPEFTDTGNVPGGAASYVTSATLPLADFKQYMTAQPVLKSMGGSLTAAKDIALASNGGTAFAKDCITGFSEHSIAHLNDGVYGNSNSWIGNSQSNFAGVAFNAPYAISSLAFGRDNGGEAATYLDRYHGHLHLPVHANAQPERRTLRRSVDFVWQASISIRSIPTRPTSLRHVYEFDPIAGVTGVRILTCSDGAGFARLHLYRRTGSVRRARARAGNAGIVGCRHNGPNRLSQVSVAKDVMMWAVEGSNLRPPACRATGRMTQVRTAKHLRRRLRPLVPLLVPAKPENANAGTHRRRPERRRRDRPERPARQARH